MPYVTLVSDWQDLANKAFKTINGDRGGVYAPTSPIAIANLGLNVSGPGEVNYGGVLKTQTGSRFILGNNEWPSLGPSHVGRTRSIRTPVHTRQCSPRYYFQDCALYTGAIQANACALLSSNGLEATPRCHLPLRTHDGGRLVTGRIAFRIPTPRTKAPAAMPKFRIIRIDEDGIIESLRATSSSVDFDGFSSFTKANSGDEWYSGGNVQFATFTCDQKNVIDTSLYTYYLELIDELGTSDPNVALSACDGSVLRERKQDVVYVFNKDFPVSAATGTHVLLGLPTPNPPTNDPGPTLAVGDRVLIAVSKDLFLPNLVKQNGIWVIGAVGWTRAADLSVNSDFTPFFEVFDTNRSVLWECTGPQVGQSFSIAGSSTLPGSPITFQKRTPRGNIYHAITCTFDSISDMRPQ